MSPRRLLFAALAATALVAAAAPSTAAQDVTSEVYLHDLYQDNDPSKGYVGCHVTNANYATYRYTVPAGSHVVLTVKAFDTNTNTHFLTVEGVGGQSGTVNAGQSTTFEFDVGEAGSRAVKCDGQTSDLQGVLIVQASDAGTNGSNDTPAPGTLAVLAGAALGAVAFTRARRRGDA